MDRKTQGWLIGGFIVVVLIAVVAAALLSSGAEQAPNTPYVGTTTTPIDSSDHVKGDTKSKVTVIEYGDFECPACGAWEPIVEDLEAKYSDRVEFVFRNFPLTQVHQNAMIAAQAAEAAALQGKYWEMHDLLYKNQSAWVNEPTTSVVSKFFDGYAQSLGLDVKKFDADVTTSAITARIQRDIDSGNAAQIDHTPTFFVNGTQIQNPNGEEPFAQLLDQALAAGLATSTKQ